MTSERGGRDALSQKQQQQQEQEPKHTLPSSLEVLQRTARLTSAAVDVNTDTTRQLCAQGEQLDAVTYTLDDTDYALKRGNRLVRGMTSWGGMIKNWFTHAPQPPVKPLLLSSNAAAQAARYKAAASTGTSASRHTDASSSSSLSTQQATATTTRAAKGQASGVACNDARGSASAASSSSACADECAARPMSAAYAARVAAEDGLIDTIHNDVLQLRDQALVHSALLSQQNEQLDRVHDKTDVVQQRLDKVSRRVREAL